MRRRVILAALLAAAVVVLAVATPWRAWLAVLASWARDAGPAGIAAFSLAYAVGSVLALPVWPLTVAAGVAYGAGWGFAVALPSGTLGASLAFLAGRSVLRGAVERRLASDPRLVAIDEAVDREGPVLVFLLRLSPLAPYNVVNYALSATRIGVGSFAAASFAGMAPITLAWAWAGDALGRL
ncbi:MAG TPA: VTT domain-containing protein, partial [Anaeromyxobacteraceae bacterium]|nr:VTT domain-containing protein [Anaeromyxobacteraceae bacterium]